MITILLTTEQAKLVVNLLELTKQQIEDMEDYGQVTLTRDQFDIIKDKL